MNSKSRRNLYIVIAIITILIGLYALFKVGDTFVGVATTVTGVSLIVVAFDEYRKGR